MSWVMSASLRPRLGIFEPGLTLGGSRSHRRRFAGLISSRLPAKLVRDSTWVRFGPIIPLDTPSTVWQPEQPFVWNRLKPASASEPAVGVSGARRWDATHAAKSSLVWTIARRRILAWDRPQNSTHWPRYTPGRSADALMRLTLPGSTSCLPNSLGTQKLWITSTLLSVST